LVSEGYDLEKAPKSFKNECYSKATALIQTCKKEVRELLTQNKEKLEALANALLIYKTLDAELLQYLIEDKDVDTPEDKNSPKESDIVDIKMVEDAAEQKVDTQSITEAA